VVGTVAILATIASAVSAGSLGAVKGALLGEKIGETISTAATTVIFRVTGHEYEYNKENLLFKGKAHINPHDMRDKIPTFSRKSH